MTEQARNNPSKRRCRTCNHSYSFHQKESACSAFGCGCSQWQLRPEDAPAVQSESGSEG